MVGMSMNVNIGSSQRTARLSLCGRPATTDSGRLVSTVLGAAMLLGVAGCGPGSSSDAGSTRTDEHADEHADELGDELGTSESESGESESGESESSEDENDWLGSSDMLPDDSPCDSFVQDCPDGEKCVPYSSTDTEFNSLRCVPVSGDQAAGEACHYDGPFQATDDCDALGYCWYVEEDSGVCLTLCLGSPESPECPPATTCSMGAAWVVHLCIPHCDPLAQSCAEGSGCYWHENSFQCVARGEDKTVGEDCEFENSCEPGLFCVDGPVVPGCEGGACCAPYCDLEQGDGPCEGALPGTVCAAFFTEDAPPQWANVGVCVLES